MALAKMRGRVLVLVQTACMLRSHHFPWPFREGVAVTLSTLCLQRSGREKLQRRGTNTHRLKHSPYNQPATLWRYPLPLFQLGPRGVTRRKRQMPGTAKEGKCTTTPGSTAANQIRTYKAPRTELSYKTNKTQSQRPLPLEPRGMLHSADQHMHGDHMRVDPLAGITGSPTQT